MLSAKLVITIQIYHANALKKQTLPFLEKKNNNNKKGKKKEGKKKETLNENLQKKIWFNEILNDYTNN